MSDPVNHSCVFGAARQPWTFLALRMSYPHPVCSQPSRISPLHQISARLFVRTSWSCRTEPSSPPRLLSPNNSAWPLTSRPEHS